MSDDTLFEDNDFLGYMNDEDDNNIIDSDLDENFSSLESDDVFQCPYCHENIDSSDIVWIEPDEGLVECPICSAQFNCGTSQY